MTQYAVVGDPIAHSKSPQIHKAFAEQTGEAVSYGKQRIESTDFAAFVRAFFADGGGGLNVTLPHKEAAFALAAERSQQALLARAANTLWMNEAGAICADNTDGRGIVHDLVTNNGIELAGKRVLMLGAGGAARGALAALVETNPQAIVVLNRTLSRAESLKEDFEAVYPLQIGDYDTEPDAAFDVLINATSASIAGAVPSIHSGYLDANSCCYDMMYSSEPTPFMQWADEHGAKKVLDGLGMLVEQAAESFSIWRGVRPETGQVISSLRN